MTYESILEACLQTLDQSLFLKRCRSGEITRAELDDFLVQQFHYSRHFTRYLCALLANLTNEGDRSSLTGNLFEEMGLGETEQVPHSRIYRDMLAKLGLDPALVPAHRETQDLADTMLKLCSNEDWVIGLGALCLGAEAIVPHLYTQIRAALIAAGYPREELTFFDIHIEGDDEHAETMRAIILRELAKDKSVLKRLHAAAVLIVRRRVAFFDGISMLRALGKRNPATANGGRNHAVQL